MTDGMWRWAKWLPLSILACTLLVACGGEPDLQIGQPAPDLNLPDARGQRLALSDLRGQVVLLNFWATWCEPCKEEMPLFQSLWETYEGAGLAIVLVSLGDEPDDVSAYIRDHGYTFHALVDTEGKADRLYMTNVLPSSFLIDPQGNLRHIWIGPIEDGESPEKLFVPLLNIELSPSPSVVAEVPRPSPTATPTRTPAPSRTWTPSPTATLIAIATTTPTPTPSQTGSRTGTRTAVPSDTATLAPPTPTGTPVPTASPTPRVYPTPVLLSPEDGAHFAAGIPAELRWSWAGDLAADEYYDVRVWPEGEPHTGVAWTKEPYLQFTGEPGIAYRWAVAVIRGQEGQMLEQLSAESEARSLLWLQPTPTVIPVYGLSLQGGGSQTAPPGTVAVFDVQLTNTGNVEDTFDVSMAPGLPGGWDAMFCIGNKCYRGGVQPVILPTGATQPIQVKIQSAPDAPSGQSGTVALLAASQGDPNQSGAVASTLIVE